MSRVTRPMWLAGSFDTTYSTIKAAITVWRTMGGYLDRFVRPKRTT